MDKVTESEFQKLCREFVSREVYCCVTTEIDYILKKLYEDSDAPYTWDDVDNLYSNIVELSDGEVDLSDEMRDALLEKLQGELDDLEMDIADLEDEIEELEADDTPADKRLRNTLLEWQEDRETLESDIELLEGSESEPQEIYEWWAVDSMLARNLLKLGHPILSDNIWGRCCTGQAIYMDHDIREICKRFMDIEIVKGD